MKNLIVIPIIVAFISSFNIYYSIKTYYRVKDNLRMQKQNITESVEINYSMFRAFLSQLYPQMETCSQFGCAVLEANYQMRSNNLRNYYQLAECNEHVKKLSEIDRYMEARFYIAKKLPVEKKKELPKIQKNYYSVVTEEVNGLYNKKCVLL